MPTPTSSERSTGAGIGSTIRRARADRGLSLADLQARTKIRAKYIAALEDERFRDLPPYPFARGFLNAVAKELGLNPEPLVRQLETQVSSISEPLEERWQRLDGAIRPAVTVSPLRRIAVIAGVTAVVVVSGLALFFAQQLRQLSEPASAVAPEAAPPAEATPGARDAGSGAPADQPAAPISAAQPGETQAGGRATPVAGAPQTASSPGSGGAGAAVPGPADVEVPLPDGGVTVDVRATGRSWLRVVADQRVLFEGFVEAGETRRWQATAAIRIRVGSAGAVALAVNGQPVAPLGRLGEVVDRTFSTDVTR